MGGTISCEALELLQRSAREHTFVTQEDANRAVDVEQRVLIRTRRNQPRPLGPGPIVDPHQSEEYWRWIAEMRRLARERIRDFAREHFMPFPE
jgi:hypothetical protein